MENQIAQAVFNNAALGIVIGDENHCIAEINPAGATMLGYQPNELIGLPIADISDPDYMEPNLTYFQELKAGKRTSYSMIKRYICKDGTPLWGKVSVSRLSALDEPVRILGILENITEQKQTQEALSYSEERFRHILGSMNDWVWEVDENAVYTFVSDNVESILGYKPQEIIGKTPFDLMPAEEAERIGVEFGRIAASNQSFRYLENLNTHKNGTPVLLETSGVPIFDYHGEFRGYRGVDRDITKSRELQNELIHSQRLQAIGELTDGIAHDFNNILHIVLGNLQLISEENRLSIDSRELLEHALNAGRQGKRLIDKLLAFSRKRPLKPRSLNLGEILENTTSVLRSTLGNSIKMRVTVEANLPPLVLDQSGLETAIMNLAINSRDAMPDGGTIVICAKRSGTDALLLRVKDQGVGIPNEHIDQIIEPFYTTKPQGQGSGLGLSMVYGFVKQSGGDLEIKNRKKKGAKITIKIPLNKPNSEEKAE